MADMPDEFYLQHATQTGKSEQLRAEAARDAADIEQAAQKPTCWKGEGLGAIVAELSELAAEGSTVESAKILLIVRRIDQWCQRDTQQLDAVSENYRQLIDTMRNCNQ